jgi:hypothetical protein
MTRECHVRFCEGLWVKSLGSTLPVHPKLIRLEGRTALRDGVANTAPGVLTKNLIEANHAAARW